MNDDRGELKTAPKKGENLGPFPGTVEWLWLISWWKFDSHLHSEFVTDSVFQTKSEWHLKIWEYRNYPLKLIWMKTAVLPCHCTNIFCETWFWYTISWELTPWFHPFSRVSFSGFGKGGYPPLCQGKTSPSSQERYRETSPSSQERYRDEHVISVDVQMIYNFEFYMTYVVL